MNTEKKLVTINVVTVDRAVEVKTKNYEVVSLANYNLPNYKLMMHESFVLEDNLKFGAFINTGILSVNLDQKVVVGKDNNLYRADDNEIADCPPKEQLFIRQLTEEEISSNRYIYNGVVYKIVAEDNTPDDDKTSGSASHSVSDKKKNKVSAKLDKLEDDTVLEFGTVAEYKELHPVDDNSTNYFIHSIKRVEHKGNYYRVTFNDCSTWDMYFNGYVKKYSCTGKMLSSGISKVGKYHERVRVVIKVNNALRSMQYERALALCKSFVEDRIPLNISEAEANMTNSSANNVRAEKLGVMAWDFRPEYIEWTTSLRNKVHSMMVDIIYAVTGEAPVLSAYNKIFDKEVFKDLFPLAKEVF